MGVEDLFKGGNIVTGLAIGLGAAVIAPMLTPILRPVAKTVIRAGLGVYEQGRVALAEANERTSDMIAEVRAEMDEEEQRPSRAKAEPVKSAGTAKA
jgi:hypothetical protein